jgi:hypothetical protein
MGLNLKKLLDKIKIGVAVGTIVAGANPKASKVLGKVQKGEEIAEKAGDIASMVHDMLKKQAE